MNHTYAFVHNIFDHLHMQKYGIKSSLIINLVVYCDYFITFFILYQQQSMHPSLTAYKLEIQSSSVNSWRKSLSEEQTN